MTRLPRPAETAAERSARPRAVQAALERLVETRPGLAEELEASGPSPASTGEGVPSLLETLVAVLSASPALGRLLLADPLALEVLRRLGEAAPVATTDAEELVGWKHRQLLRIAARDLLGLDSLEQTGRLLSDVADAVLGAARALAGCEAEGIAVVAMGKAGAQELNYSSDVDIVLVGEGDPRALLDVARRAFRVDVDLRPEGRAGPLLRSLESYRVYWARWAAAWERQALLKARPVAGPAELEAAFADAAASAVWEHHFSAEDLRSLRAIKARAEGEVARRRLADREIKRGPGGIRDIEFSVQLLQLIHGRQDPALRVPATLAALEELERAGYVGAEDAKALEAAYRFLRTVENRLQMGEGQRVHTVPADAPSREVLARVVGYAAAAGTSAAERFGADLRRHRAVAREIHERLFFRPLLEVFGDRGGPQPIGPAMSLAAAGERLKAFGFADSDRARSALVDLTRGLTRSSRLMQALLPLMLQWLSLSPDPDRGLSGLRQLMGRPGPHRDAMIALFRESPEAARRLCVLVGTSTLFAERLRRDPALLARVATPGGLEARQRDDLADQAAATVRLRSDPTHRQRALARFKASEEAVVMAADVLGEADVAEVGRRLSDLAEATIAAAIAAVEPSVPLGVIGLGSFGGRELIYASDLDVLVVFGSPAGTGPPSAEEDRAAETDAVRLLKFLNGETPVRRIFLLDADLRPEGRDGPLARTVEGYSAYYRRWAGAWERQALLRARPVAGDPELCARFMEMAGSLTGRGLDDTEVREIRRMKARVEAERIPPGEDPDFHLKLGRGSLSDVEWTVQLLQLREGLVEPSTLRALDALAEAGALSSEDRRRLAESFVFCQRLRDRLFLVQGAPGDSLPSTVDRLAVLARSLDVSPSQLRDRYRQVTRRARRVTERLFYGRS